MARARARWTCVDTAPPGQEDTWRNQMSQTNEQRGERNSANSASGFSGFSGFSTVTLKI